MIVFYRGSVYTVVEPGQGPVSDLSWKELTASGGKTSSVPDDVLDRVLKGVKGGASAMDLWLEEGEFYEPAIVTTEFRTFVRRSDDERRHMFKEECDLTLPAIELANRAFWKSVRQAERDQARVTDFYRQMENEDRAEEEERSQDLCRCGEERKEHHANMDPYHVFVPAEED